jgi:phenylalanyl-tRNA synthetase beta chain
VDFDLSFLVTEATEAGDLVAATSSAAGTFLESARVFDEFRDASLGEGMKAIAITYRVRAPDRTLDASEIAAVRGAMIKAGEELGARLRGA